MLEQHGIPIDFVRGLRPHYPDAVAQVIGGTEARQLGTVYRNGSSTADIKPTINTFDQSVDAWLADRHHNMDFEHGFSRLWQRAERAHNQLARDLFGTDEAEIFDLTNTIASAPLLPHDFYKALNRDANPRFAHEARVLAAFTGVLLAAEDDESDIGLRSVFQRINGRISEQMCVGKYGETTPGTLWSSHDPNTLATSSTYFSNDISLKFNDEIHRLTHRSRLPIRTMIVGERRLPFFTTTHRKSSASIIAKATERGMGKEGKKVIDPTLTVRDNHGLLVVSMNESDYELMKDSYLNYVSKLFPDAEVTDDHKTSHGLGTSAQFQRYNVYVDPSNRDRYVELMFQKPAQYKNGLVHIGDGRKGYAHAEGDKKGYAHELHVIRRLLRKHKQPDGNILSAAELIFPQSIYGVDPRELAEQNMERIAERIRRSLIVTRRDRFGEIDIA